MAHRQESARTARIQCLLDQLGEDREGAWSELVEATCNRIRRMARGRRRAFRFVLHEAWTDDVVDGVVLRLSAAMRRLRPPQNPGEFFKLVGAHLQWELSEIARRMRRDHKRMGLIDGGSIPASFAAEPRPTRLEGSALDTERIHDAIEDLDPTQRDLVLLVFYQDFSCSEAASILGLSRSTAWRQWMKAQSRLFTKLRTDVACSTNDAKEWREDEPPKEHPAETAPPNPDLEIVRPK